MNVNKCLWILFFIGIVFFKIACECLYWLLDIKTELSWIQLFLCYLGITPSLIILVLIVILCNIDDESSSSGSRGIKKAYNMIALLVGVISLWYFIGTVIFR
jgi:hypothetical protein